MKFLRTSAAALIVAVCVSPSLWAKGPTTRIVIITPVLPVPLELTDPALLDKFAVWAGPGTSLNGVEGSEGFIIDWRAGAPAGRFAELPRYEVRFYSKVANRPAESQSEHLAYVVFYTPDSGGGRGLVYLPARGEQHFALNVRTIFRGVEGRWFRATDAWDRTVDSLLRRQR